ARSCVSFWATTRARTRTSGSSDVRPVGARPCRRAASCGIVGAPVAPFKIRLGGKTMVVPEGEHDIGRNLDCWLTLDDELASRNHARLHVAGDRAEVEDLGSRNGTFVNDRRLTGRQV